MHYALRQNNGYSTFLARELYKKLEYKLGEDKFKKVRDIYLEMKQ